VHLHAATLAALRALAETGDPVEARTLLDTLYSAGDLCPSTFVSPDDPTGRVRHCAGKPHHPGVMHGGDGAVWGDNAGAESHPGETLVVRLDHYRKMIAFQQAVMDQAGDVMRKLITRHQPTPARSDPAVELCAGCGKVWPCPDAVILGIDQATPEEIAAAMAGLGPRPVRHPDDVPAPAATGGPS
jgi:hypothetical protein